MGYLFTQGTLTAALSGATPIPHTVLKVNPVYLPVTH